MGEIQSLHQQAFQILPADPNDNPTLFQLRERLRTKKELVRVGSLWALTRKKNEIQNNHNVEILLNPDVLQGLDLEAFVPLAREDIFGCSREEEEQWDVVPEGTEDPYLPVLRKMVFLYIQNLLENNCNALLFKEKVLEGFVILAHISSLVDLWMHHEYDNEDKE